MMSGGSLVRPFGYSRLDIYLDLRWAGGSVAVPTQCLLLLLAPVRLLSLSELVFKRNRKPPNPCSFTCFYFLQGLIEQKRTTNRRKGTAATANQITIKI